MPTHPFRLALIGAAATFMATTALAQTVVETPGGNTAIIADPALEPQAPVGAVAEPAFPLPAQLDNDQAVIEALLSQGFTDIHILREGAIMTVTAQRNGQPTELVYSIANGSLISVDGVEMRAQPDATSNGGSDVARDVLGEDGGTGTGEDDGTDTGEGGTDAGGTDGTDTGGTDPGGTDGTDTGGTDAGGDGSGSDGSGSDGGTSDGDAGSDGGADGSDSGSDGGSDGAGDGSDGGSDGSGTSG